MELSTLLASPETYASLLTLSLMEIVLGIDNIIFISIICGRLPAEERNKGRVIGLAGAFVSRLILLMALAWIVKLTQPIVTIFDIPLSGRSLILLAGGLFLMGKATQEIHHKVEGDINPAATSTGPKLTMAQAVFQIAMLDIIFSLDSVITAVGMAQSIAIMVIANVIALVVMVAVSKKISAFIDENPTIKMLALSFLLLIGTMLVAEALTLHVPKGYIYFAMGFSALVEGLNMRAAKKRRSHAHP
jgi:predicted tellurium resistance membrane protein TerC